MTEKRGMKALELWCRRVTEGYPGVKIENMTTSWRDGLAFCALIHHFRPDLIDFDTLDKSDIYKNNELAFRIAERQLGIPALLDAEDMVEYEVPDRLSILTYLSQFYQTFVSNQQGATASPARTHNSKVSEIISPAAKTPKASKVGSGRLETCWSCRRPVFLAERLVAGGKLRHRTCFTCKRCGNQLNLVGCYETETGDFVCETCPDEEKHRSEDVREEVPNSAIETIKYPKNSLSVETKSFERIENSGSSMKKKLVSDRVDSSTGEGQDLTEKNMKSLPPECANSNQHSTAFLEKLNTKLKSVLGRDCTETLSFLNHEPENFIADISEIIDSIICDAVKEVEHHLYEIPEKNNTSNVPDELKLTKIKEVDKSCLSASDVDFKNIKVTKTSVISEIAESKTMKISSKKDDEKKLDFTIEFPENKADDYPEDLNPFAEDDDNINGTKTPQHMKPNITPRKTHQTAMSEIDKLEKNTNEKPVKNLNPFWSDGEPSSDDEVKKPVPVPRTTLKSSEEVSPLHRSHYGSFTSLNSVGSTLSKKKKGPAPAPPSNIKSFQSPSNISLSPSCRSPSPSASIRSHRKSKPAPPPPISTTIFRSDENELLPGKNEKNYENKMRQNLSVPDKSSYGKWKRKKGQAPSLPIPQRRRIKPLPLHEFYRELEDLEIQQRELERQGVNLEQTIRMYEEETLDELQEIDPNVKDIESLILQLFDIVNQKNELFRRQAELMYLRRQQRLEEEHADIEFQIRCLMGRPERNKTDTDKEQEEELIRRLVEIVERRNEIIECLDMDRKREVEEDRSIHHHLEALADKKETDSSDHPPEGKPKFGLKSSPSLLKFVKKKKSKKDKSKDTSPAKIRRDFDKDVDEAISEEEQVKSSKTKKKWFAKS